MSPTLFGVSPYGALRGLGDTAPAPQVVRLFLPPGRLVDDWSKLPAQARWWPGVPLVLSWKDDDPAKARALLESAPDGAVAGACFFHEPEDDYATTSSQAAFRKRQEAHAAAVRATGVPYSPIFMAWSLIVGRGIEKWWAGPEHTDVLGWDVYNEPHRKGLYEAPRDVVARVADFSETHGLPWGVGETASPVAAGTTPDDRTVWARELRAEYTRRGARWACWWDEALNGFDYRLDQQTAEVWLAAPAPADPPQDPRLEQALADLAAARADLAAALDGRRNADRRAEQAAAAHAVLAAQVANAKAALTALFGTSPLGG